MRSWLAGLAVTAIVSSGCLSTFSSLTAGDPGGEGFKRLSPAMKDVKVTMRR